MSRHASTTCHDACLTHHIVVYLILLTYLLLVLHIQQSRITHNKHSVAFFSHYAQQALSLCPLSLAAIVNKYLVLSRPSNRTAGGTMLSAYRARQIFPVQVGGQIDKANRLQANEEHSAALNTTGSRGNKGRWHWPVSLMGTYQGSRTLWQGRPVIQKDSVCNTGSVGSSPQRREQKGLHLVLRNHFASIADIKIWV
jgi:hypothetical protein